ncbi:hypothetical protein RJ640_026270 [Escallonia rubra]|uniref:Mini-chromosome maintenance complex-binding protein n=1 Tax=Escallonia rubra TaxID=112253 RepID=A0AA88UP30_9ASTE|nr:hypothetical protein RJ640_026270 [Escallonia rubra]
MVGRPYDCLANPLGAVRLTFDKAVASGSDPATLGGKDWGATDLFREFLYDNGGLSQVPVLSASTVHSIQPNSLVRFRGMIQDMLGNEFYVGAYKNGDVWGTNKFTDVCQYSMDSSCDTRIWERRLLYCVPVPGQNYWTDSSSEAVNNPCTNSTSSPREKRLREDDAVADYMDMQVMPFPQLYAILQVSGEEFQSPPCAKKMREGGLPSQSSRPQESTSEATCSGTIMMPEFDHKSFPCLVKIYDSPDSDLKLNDVFEFVGVLTLDPELTVSKDDFSDELTNGFCEDALSHLPSSKCFSFWFLDVAINDVAIQYSKYVPRLHCIIHRKLAVHDFLSGSTDMEPKSDLVKGIREALLGHLTTVLGNDGVAANFMLLHLLSRVHTRVDTVAVGKFSLNFTCFSKESMYVFGNRIKLAVKNFLPFTHFLPLTVDYLNTASLAPVKDYETNRLVSGLLQLAEGSHLTIDETQLQSGTLNPTGVENSRLLKNLMEFQKVEYDFKFYKMEMTADVQLLVLSEGKSTILPADLVVPFCPISVDSCEIVDVEILNLWRWYLAILKTWPHSIDSEMQKVVEDDLVAARKADRSLGSQDFSRLLTLGRLMAISFGEKSLSLEHWQMVKELERLRRERLQIKSAIN